MGSVRIVLDANILVRADPRTSPHGLASALIKKVVRGPSTLIVSTPLLDELGRVLRYPRLQARWALSDADIDSYLHFLKEAASFVELDECWAAVPEDPDDDPIVQTAIIGRAEVLCTRDPHFFHPLAQEYCRAYGIRVVDDLTLMDELR